MERSDALGNRLDPSLNPLRFGSGLRQCGKSHLVAKPWLPCYRPPGRSIEQAEAINMPVPALSNQWMIGGRSGLDQRPTHEH